LARRVAPAISVPDYLDFLTEFPQAPCQERFTSGLQRLRFSAGLLKTWRVKEFLGSPFLFASGIGYKRA
jgi:hypothetical protein